MQSKKNHKSWYTTYMPLVLFIFCIFGMTDSVSAASIQQADNTAEISESFEDPRFNPEEARDAAVNILSNSGYEREEKKKASEGSEAKELNIPDRKISLPSFLNGPIFAVILFAFILGVAIFLITQARKFSYKKQHSPEITFIQEEKTTYQWREIASQCEREQQWAHMIRAWYRVLLGELVEGSFLREIPGGTSGEYETLAKRVLPQIATKFSMATEYFEKVWYGKYGVDASRSTAYKELCEDILTGVKK